jgi:hypothetical protein
MYAASAEAAQRLVGKAAADFGLAMASSAEQQQAAPPDLQQAAARLRTEGLKQLLNLFGVGHGEAGGVGFAVMWWIPACCCLPMSWWCIT